MRGTLEHQGGVSLRRILPQSRMVGATDIRVRACTSNVRSCRPGDLFVALETAAADGHFDVGEAIERGATAVLTERLVPARVPVCMVPDTREAYGHVCQAIAGTPHDYLRLVGVSGTHGKTTTACLVQSVLESAGQATGALTDIGYDDGVDVSDPPPPADPTQFARWLTRMATAGCEAGVVEVSSQTLAERQISGVQFDAVVMTNLRRDHLDLHHSQQNYHRVKSRLFQQLKPGGFVVANADDPATCRILETLDVPTITIGLEADAELSATLIEQHAGEQTFVISAGGESMPVRTRTIGSQHIYNCLSAAAVGLVLGHDLATVVRGLERVSYVPGRLERIERGQPFAVYVDAAQTPDTLANAAKTIRRVTEGRLICVFGATGHHDPALRPLLGRVAERTAHLPIITSQHPGYEEPLQIAHDILDGFADPSRAHLMPDRERAIQWALEQARPGDAVLVAGHGAAATQRMGGVDVPFSDREVVRQHLDALAHAPADSPNLIPFPRLA